MKHLLPKAAFEMLQKSPEALFIDVRSEMEFLLVGHPKGALHVGWNDGPDWDVNPHFVGEVAQTHRLGKQPPGSPDLPQRQARPRKPAKPCCRPG